VVCVLFAVVTVLFAGPIMGWFSDDAEVLHIGLRYIWLSGAVMPFMAFSTYVNQLYQCLGFKGQATLLASCRQGIFFLPAVLLLPLGLQTLGVVAAQPLADFCTFLVSIPFLILFYRRYVREDNGLGGMN
jgi:Na+-driven multidrug efflux pump